MIERRQQELKLVEVNYGELELPPNLEWLLVKHWELPFGWSKEKTRVLILIPPGYPVTPPDNFYTDRDLCLASGAAPGNASDVVEIIGSLWRRFSFHVDTEDWKPSTEPLNGHNLLTFLQGVTKRLSEVN